MTMASAGLILASLLVVCSLAPALSQPAGDATTVTITETNIESGSTTWAAGDTLTLKLKSKSKSDNYVKIGKINLGQEAS